MDYTPVVDIRTVKAHKRKNLKSAIIETAKYPVKPFDVDTEDVTLFSEMVKRTDNRRFDEWLASKKADWFW